MNAPAVAPAGSLSADELFGLARQMDRAALAIELRDEGLCPPMLLRLLQEDLVARAVHATALELQAGRAVAASPRHRPPHRRLRWRRGA